MARRGRRRRRKTVSQKILVRAQREMGFSESLRLLRPFFLAEEGRRKALRYARPERERLVTAKSDKHRSYVDRLLRFGDRQRVLAKDKITLGSWRRSVMRYRRLLVCDARGRRRELLFSDGKAGKGKRIGERRHFDEESKVRC